MFSLSHIYITSQVTRSNDNLLLLGSILPDAAWVGPEGQDLRPLHSSPMDFYHYVEKEHPDMLNMAVGFVLHSDFEKGADFFSHDETTGYAMTEGAILRPQIELVSHIHDQKELRVIGHTCIEIAVDLHLNKSQPSVLDTYRQLIKGANIHKIAQLFSDFFQKDNSIYATALEKLFSYTNPLHFQSVDNAVLGMLIPYFDFKYGKKLTVELTTPIIEAALDITHPTWQVFLGDTIESIRKSHAELIKLISV